MRIKKLLPVLFLVLPLWAGAAPLSSPSWGFTLDLPEDYQYIQGDGKDRFSFASPDGAVLDIVVYAANGPYQSVRELASDTQRRIENNGDMSFFDYRYKEAAVLELVFSSPSGQDRPQGRLMTGWALALELENAEAGKPGPLLIALAYGPEEQQDLQLLHLSILDSIAPRAADLRNPGPITEFSYPGETRISVPLFGLDEEAWFYKEDEEASQALIDREFMVLQRYANSEFWEDAWSRYYRAIYRDSSSRMENAAFVIERKLNQGLVDQRKFAEEVLAWVQTFRYERDFAGSDFINLIQAVREGRGDCDTLAMLWALVLNQANIPAAMMVSREYSHAMGLADLDGQGARFTLANRDWVVAETTTRISLGLIAQDYSDSSKWLGIILER